MTEDLLDALHPFSFITDKSGIVQSVGRSLHKILPQCAPGQHFSESLAITQPSSTVPSEHPSDLVGELLVMRSAADQRVKLRGQVIANGSHFLFAMELSISNPSDISALNLSITDFRLADPIFDFLLFMQGQAITHHKLQEAKRALEWKNKISSLLLSIALSTEERDDEEAIYRTTLDAVRQAFGWDVGHVLLLADEPPERLVSSGLWSMNDCERYAPFYNDTCARQFKRGEGIPGRVLEAREVLWIDGAEQDESFPRRGSLAKIGPVTGAGLPVFVGERVVAVIEFFKSKGDFDAEALIRFFTLLSLQLSAVIARQRAEVEARRHLAGLANASKMATLGEIAAGVAHEINNPLHTLALTSHLLQKLSKGERLTTEILQGHLDKIESCVQRMATIVAELKAFSRDSANDNHKTISLRALVSETLDLCHARLVSKDIRLTVCEIPDSWEVECHPSQISQVLLNLLNNAYDAALGQGERWVRLDVADRGECFEISVTDSGPGIPPAIARKIMDPFFTTKPPGKGTGLGLSISTNIMTDHGGALTLDTKSPYTRFVMLLPKDQKHRANRPNEPFSGHEQSSDGEGVGA